MQYACDLLRREKFRTDGDLERSGKNVGERELAIVAGEDFLFGGLIVTRENDVCSADRRPGRIHDRSADISRRLRVGLLIRSVGRTDGSTLEDGAAGELFGAGGSSGACWGPARTGTHKTKT